MANLQSFYQAPAGVALPFQLGQIQQNEAQSREDAGLTQNRLGVQYGRTLTGLVNDASSKGTARGGQVGVRGDQAREDFNYQNSDVQRLLNRHLADLQYNRIMATLGTTLGGTPTPTVGTASF